MPLPRRILKYLPISIRRITAPKGFDRPIPARERKWKTKTGKANFIVPSCLSEDPDLPQRRDGVLTLITVRSNDQFNTTVYGYQDRLRGIYGTRMVMLMNAHDMAEGRSRTVKSSICSALPATTFRVACGAYWW